MAQQDLAQNSPIPAGRRLSPATFRHPTFKPDAMSWLCEDACEYRDQAQALLDKVKDTRRKMNTRIVRVNENTWIEQNNNPKEIKHKTMIQHVTRQQAEEAVAVYRTAKEAKTGFEIQMAQAERIIDAFGREHMTEFTDNRLELDSGTLAVKAGVARPVKDGKPLPTAARSQLAAMLPDRYVRLTCDFGGLFGCEDKIVRKILQAQQIEVVRDDKFVIL